MTPGVTQLVRLTARPGHRDELADLLRRVVTGTDDEPGTRTYAVYTGADPNTIWILEQYADAEAVRAHMSGKALAAIRPQLLDLRVGPPEVVPLTLVAAKGAMET